MTSATFDTNVLPAKPLIARAQRLGIMVATITVSLREAEGSSVEDDIRELESVLETAVWGESTWDQSMWATGHDDLERILNILSNGSFPPIPKRGELSRGQLNQMRDAMILCAHVRSRRDLLVSNDARAFIKQERRRIIEEEFKTRIMTTKEFEAHLAELEESAVVVESDS